MVRVWYEPPPYGPGTSLDRSPYGPQGGGVIFRRLLERASKSNPVVAMSIPIAAALVICYIPLMNQKLPFSMEPEYLAAQRAYMRYHNMNPIFGESSKRNRAIHPDP